MAVDERNLLLRWAPTLMGVSTLVWAGARSSVRGGQLHRDGALGRIVLRGECFEAPVREEALAEHVSLSLVDGAVQASCSCGARRCAHAVTVLIDLQRRARSAHDTARTQDSVMGALRQRLQARQEGQLEERRVLSNLERLPLDAAVDLVALTWRQSLRPGAPELRDLQQLTERLVAEAVQQPLVARSRVIRLVAALAVRKVVFVPLPTAVEPELARLVAILDLSTPAGDEPGLAVLCDAALDGPPQLSPGIATSLARQAARNPVIAAELVPRLLAWRREVGDQAWRESSQPGGRDLLWDQLGGLILAGGDIDTALRLGLAWGPGRTHLQDLAGRLGAEDRPADVQSLLGWYDPRGELWQVGCQAAVKGAGDRGHGAAAQTLAIWAFERQPTQPWFAAIRAAASPASWPRLRDGLTDRAVADDDAVWLAEALADDVDAPVALRRVVQVAPTRDRTVRACLQRLDQLAPLIALQARQLRLAGLCVQAAPGVKLLRVEVQGLFAAASAAGEPGLAADFVRLLAREYADVPAIAQATAPTQWTVPVG